MTLIELRIPIPWDQADAAEEVLLELGRLEWSLLLQVDHSRAEIVGTFTRESVAKGAWVALQSALSETGIGVLGGVASRELRDEDWQESYKVHFKPWSFGRLHWVPVWERGNFSHSPGDKVLWLDPGMAFGTGNHPTTRLCCERILEIADDIERRIPLEKIRLVDAGCGSGILALSAALLGFGDVRGFDIDPEAVRVSRENAATNGLREVVPFQVSDLGSGLAGAEADVLLANIQADVLLANAELLISAVAPGGSLVLSGILASERGRVEELFCRLASGWSLESRNLDEWSDLHLTRRLR